MLTIIEKNLVAKLPVTQKHYILAKFSGKIILECQNPELEVLISEMVNDLFLESGKKLAPEDAPIIKFISQTLFKDLRTPRFNALTFHEVKLACNYGIRHVYGPYMGVNVSTIHFWIKSYLASSERLEAIKEFNNIVNKSTYQETRDLKPDLEGQKKVVELFKSVLKEIPPEEKKKKIVKPVREKSPRDLYIQKMFLEFQELATITFKGKRFIKVSDKTEEKTLDEVEYVELKLKEYDNQAPE